MSPYEKQIQEIKRKWKITRLEVIGLSEPEKPHTLEDVALEKERQSHEGKISLGSSAFGIVCRF